MSHVKLIDKSKTKTKTKTKIKSKTRVNSIENKPIDIVLASCNGESFIKAQIQSIQQNTQYQQLVANVIVVDDNSNDNTVNIIKALAKQDAKIVLHQHKCNNSSSSKKNSRLGVVANFSKGLLLSNNQYVMLADQDDIWLPNKIELSYQKIVEQEQLTPDNSQSNSDTFHDKQIVPEVGLESTPEISSEIKAEENAKTQPCIQPCIQPRVQPCLVFSDLTVVDQSLITLCPSYFVLKKIPKTWHLSFGQLLQQNVVSGCTMICNRPLLDIALPLPEEKNIYMHDWWLALLAAKYGKLVFIDKPLMLYRQHSNNTIGAKKVTLFEQITQVKSKYAQFNTSLIKISQQSATLQNIDINAKPSAGYLANNDNNEQVCNRVATIFKQSIMQRLIVFFSGQVTRSHLQGKLCLLLVLLTKQQQK